MMRPVTIFAVTLCVAVALVLPSAAQFCPDCAFTIPKADMASTEFLEKFVLAAPEVCACVLRWPAATWRPLLVATLRRAKQRPPALTHRSTLMQDRERALAELPVGSAEHFWFRYLALEGQGESTLKQRAALIADAKASRTNYQFVERMETRLMLHSIPTGEGHPALLQARARIFC